MTDKLARTARRSHVANDWLRPFLSDTGLGAVRDLYPTAACEHDAAALFASISKQLGKDEARRIFSDLLVRPAGRKPLDGGKTTRKDAALLTVYGWEKEKDPKMTDDDFAFYFLDLKGKKKDGKSDEQWKTEISAVKRQLQRARKRIAQHSA